MSLYVELERLAGLGPILNGLAGEYDRYTTADLLPGGEFSYPSATAPHRSPTYPLQPTAASEPAVLEAVAIAQRVVDGLLIPGVRERLAETGEIMVHTAENYRTADDNESTLGEASRQYTTATGDWDVPEAPR